jgi:tRNA 5-methylaminomethyl-2-thiouridine biosynthesis bifunctional protein
VRTALVIGAGLAGSAVAAALAQRGLAVTVIDAAQQPAAGASSLPVGLMAPLVAKHDTAAAQLSRLGIAHTTQQARVLLREGIDWQPCGALQYDQSSLPNATRTAHSTHHTQQNPEATRDVWHAHAAWIKPAALVRAWLSTQGVQFVGNAAVAHLALHDGQWTARNAAQLSIAHADIVVMACAAHCVQLLHNLRVHDVAAPFLTASQQIAQQLHAVAGQVIYGPWNPDWHSAAPQRAGLHHACNGNGHFIAAVPAQTGVHAEGEPKHAHSFWLSGSTYEHHVAHPAPTSEGIHANTQRLLQLLPHAKSALTPQLAAGNVQAWAGQRCTTRDRLPVVGAVQASAQNALHHRADSVAAGLVAQANTEGTIGLYLCTGMGSRGLSYASLCAHALAAQISGLPGPLSPTLQQAIDPARLSL